MIPYGRQDINQSDIDAVVAVLRSDWLTQGPVVPQFEDAVARYTGAAYGVAVNSATSALHIACLALGVGPGDWVWTSSNTFVASANCALYCGAQVDFVDIDPLTYNMSETILEAKLESAEKMGCLPKVVIPVHFAGQPCKMDQIHRLRAKYGFRVLEDASHAIGALYDEKKIGSCYGSDIAVFSFHPVKIITTGEGGMAMTNDPGLAEKMARLRTHGVTTDRGLMQSRPHSEIWNYQQIELGYNYRMTDIEAALGLSQLTELDEFVRRRREIAARYDRELADLPITLPWQAPGTRSSYHLYPICVKRNESGLGQRSLYDELRDSGILANLHYIPVHRQPFFEQLGFTPGYCLNAEEYFRTSLSIPLFSGLSDIQQSTIIERLRSLLGRA